MNEINVLRRLGFKWLVPVAANKGLLTQDDTLTDRLTFATEMVAACAIGQGNRT